MSVDRGQIASSSGADTRPVTGAARGLSTAQRDRRAKILHAARALASEGGYDAVSMREVADRAGVAGATVYRHFPSKDHLLLAVMADAIDRLHARLRPVAPTVADRIFVVLDRSCRSMFRTPALSGAILRAWAQIGADAGPDAARIAETTRAGLVRALAREPTEEDLLVLKALNRLWFGELLFWVNGRETSDEVLQTLRAASSRMFPATSDDVG